MFFSRSIIMPALLGLTIAQSSSLVPTISASQSLASSTGSASLNSSSTKTGSGALQTGTVATHVIEVGGANGSLIFSPNNIQAQVGDMVQFQFYAKNHSVVQSTFDQPCIPMQNSASSKTNAFYSGFMPTNATIGSKSNILTYTIRVNDAKPLWFYCSQGKHCQEGMVGAVNAPANGNKTIAAFKALAANAVANVSPSTGSGTQNGTQSGSQNGSQGGSQSGSQSGTGATSPSASSSITASGTSGGGAATTSTGVAVSVSNGASGLSSQPLFSLGVVAVAAWVIL